MPRWHFIWPRQWLQRCARCRVCRRSRLVFGSLFYNSQLNHSYALDTCLAPMFWLVENYVRRFGPLFVAFLMSMMGVVVCIVFVVIIPYEVKFKSYAEIVFYLSVGHYLLLNTLFNYGMAWRTSPGFVPTNEVISSAVGMCKQCIAPKPPRAHHCSVCNRCILKMDHHCPWLNQCVGHYNHRYFMLTMVYMWCGCALIAAGMWPCFAEHYWQNEQSWCEEMWSSVGYSHWLCDEPPPIRAGENGTMLMVDAGDWGGGADWQTDHHGGGDDGTARAYNSIVTVFLVCIGMIVGVGSLLVWHIRLVCRGETSIEIHINSETKRRWAAQGKIYQNPYDFGWRENWRILLGIERGRGYTFWRHILWPSRHPPVGDGMAWRTSTYDLDETSPLPTGVTVQRL